MNKLIIIGNLTRTPELRHTQDGTAVCSFTVAVNRPKTKTNQNPGADYFNVSAWRALGENCAKFLDKGSKACVTGSVSVRTWEKDGKHGASLELNAEGVEFLNSRTAEQPAPVVDPSGMEVVSTDELPF
jgi:single-strand DNA-binding protein